MEAALAGRTERSTDPRRKRRPPTACVSPPETLRFTRSSPRCGVIPNSGACFETASRGEGGLRQAFSPAVAGRLRGLFRGRSYSPPSHQATKVIERPYFVPWCLGGRPGHIHHQVTKPPRVSNSHPSCLGVLVVDLILACGTADRGCEVVSGDPRGGKGVGPRFLPGVRPGVPDGARFAGSQSSQRHALAYPYGRAHRAPSVRARHGVPKRQSRYASFRGLNDLVPVRTPRWLWSLS